jgi:carbon starvation protein
MRTRQDVVPEGLPAAPEKFLHERGEIVSGVTIIVVSAVILIVGYVVYGGWLAKTWGINSEKLTPAVRMEDGKNFVPASRFTVFAHQFSSICGAGPVTGTIIAMMFGWVPVLLWVLIGGIFFGAVHDFGALYASVKNNGKSLGQLIEKYIGKTGRRLFLLFSWVFCCIVVAAFTAMVAGTFQMTLDSAGAVDTGASYAAGAAGTISILFTFAAIIFGKLSKQFSLTGLKQLLLAIALIVIMFALGMAFPIYLSYYGWVAVVMVYLVFASGVSIQTLKQPRDYITTIMMIAMIACAVIGIFILSVNGQGDVSAPAFNGFVLVNATTGAKSYLFPLLFVSVACGALSGFHSLVSSGTSSKQVSDEADMQPVGYGAMVVESFVGVVAIVCAAIVYKDMNVNMVDANGAALYTPFKIFATGIANSMTLFGVNKNVATVFMTMNVSALALTSLDAVARIARSSFQEFFAPTNDVLDVESAEGRTGFAKLAANRWFATGITLLGGLALTFGGYLNVWPLFGASNQLLGGMCMITLAVFCKCTGRKGGMLYVPVAFLLVCTFTSLVQSILSCVSALSAGGVMVIATSGLQLVVAVLLVVLGLIVSYNCLKELFVKKPGSIPDEEPEWSEQGRADYLRRSKEHLDSVVTKHKEHSEALG